MGPVRHEPHSGFGHPVIAITILLVVFERLFQIGIFNPTLGGDPVLMQHLFWSYSHPAVYIMILPGFGVISEVIACFSRRRIFGYSFVAFSSLAIAILGFLVWGHHMFVAGQSTYAGMVFSFLTFLVAYLLLLRSSIGLLPSTKGRFYSTHPCSMCLASLAYSPLVD